LELTQRKIGKKGMEQIVIVGNGVAGITAARWLRKLGDAKIYVISSESAYFFSRTALMYVYMGHMLWKDIEPYPRDFYSKNRIDLLHTKVQSIDFQSKIVLTEGNKPLAYDRLILATGSKSKSFDFPGNHLKGISSFYYKQDLEHLNQISDSIKHAVIVGGGLIGIELAEMFCSRNIPVTMLVRETDYWAHVLPEDEARMISRHIQDHKIDLQLETRLQAVMGDETGHVNKIITDKGAEINCNFVALAIGVVPNIDIVQNTHLECDHGILVNEYLETNIEHVYAIGDCAQLRDPILGRKATETAWYIAKAMGKTLAHHICQQPTAYQQVLWYNSAKLLDIEYQVYGQVPAQIKYPLNSLHLELPNGRQSIRITYDHDTKVVKGFLLMGFRFRQDVCERWILNKTVLENVVSYIRLAFFEPEFYKGFARRYMKKFNIEFGKSAYLKTRGSFDSVLKFFKRSKKKESDESEHN